MGELQDAIWRNAKERTTAEQEYARQLQQERQELERKRHRSAERAAEFIDLMHAGGVAAKPVYAERTTVSRRDGTRHRRKPVTTISRSLVGRGWFITAARKEDDYWIAGPVILLEDGRALNHKPKYNADDTVILIDAHPDGPHVRFYEDTLFDEQLEFDSLTYVAERELRARGLID